MIFDNDGNPVEQNGKGLNRPDGFGDIPDRGGAMNTVTCPTCGQITMYSADIKQTNPVERKCPKCGRVLGVW